MVQHQNGSVFCTLTYPWQRQDFTSTMPTKWVSKVYADIWFKSFRKNQTRRKNKAGAEAGLESLSTLVEALEGF